MAQKPERSRLAEGAPNDTEISAQAGPPSEGAHEAQTAEAGPTHSTDGGQPPEQPSVADHPPAGADLLKHEGGL